MEEEKKEINDASIEEVVVENEIEETEEEKKDKKIKNLISTVILLAGLFLGSLFVDAVQMIRGGGFSERALSNADVLTAGGKTWVAFAEPIVKVQVISDDTCDACKPDEVLVGLKQALPTMQNEKIDVNSAAGKKLIAQFNFKTIPAFVFSKEIEKTDLFTKAQPFLDKQGESYAIKSAEAGFPVGRFISPPQISDQDATFGSVDAGVKVVVFNDFKNPTDKAVFQAILSPMIKDYGDKIQVAFKSYFPPTSTQSMSAALAAACANEQGKFLAYADKLFTAQATWSKAKDATALLKSYAAPAGLNAGDFGKCLDAKKYQDLITAALSEGQVFGINATPSIFIGTDLQAPTVKYDDIKNVIDEQLNK
jgi:hypothetical protein